jgi:hypothetical protein
MKCDYKELEQYDYYDEDYLEKVIEKYSFLVGLFIIRFSSLEHEIDTFIADRFGDDYHETGYVIIENLSISNKIDLFYKMYLRIESLKEKNNRKTLENIKNRLIAMNTFRNFIAHANWGSLTKDGFVRVKIMVDNQEGYVKLKNIQITTKILRDNLKEIDKLLNLIFKYKESALVI